MKYFRKVFFIRGCNISSRNNLIMAKVDHKTSEPQNGVKTNLLFLRTLFATFQKAIRIEFLGSDRRPCFINISKHG